MHDDDDLNEYICLQRYAVRWKVLHALISGDSWWRRSKLSTLCAHAASTVEKFRMEIVYSYQLASYAYRQGIAVIVFNFDVKWRALFHFYSRILLACSLTHSLPLLHLISRVHTLSD